MPQMHSLIYLWLDWLRFLRMMIPLDAVDSTIAQRKEILAQKRAVLEQRLTEIQGDIDYIDKKQQYYDILLAGETPSPGILAELRRRPDSAPRQ